MQRLPQSVLHGCVHVFFAALGRHALDFVADGRLIKGLAEPRIIFETPTTGWIPKEKQVAPPLVSYAPSRETLHRRQTNELDARSSQLGDPAPLSVTSSPILGVCAAAGGCLQLEEPIPRLLPDLAESRHRHAVEPTPS